MTVLNRLKTEPSATEATFTSRGSWPRNSHGPMNSRLTIFSRCSLAAATLALRMHQTQMHPSTVLKNSWSKRITNHLTQRNNQLGQSTNCLKNILSPQNPQKRNLIQMTTANCSMAVNSTTLSHSTLTGLNWAREDSCMLFSWLRIGCRCSPTRTTRISTRSTTDYSNWSTQWFQRLIFSCPTSSN